MANVETKPNTDGHNLRELRRSLQAASASTLAVLLRTAIFNSVWQWLALLAVAFALDLSFGLPVVIRWIVLALLVGFVGFSAYKIVREQQSFPHNDEWAARLIEERVDDADNAIINGIQFERILSDEGVDYDVSELMRLEVERAYDTAERIGGFEIAVDRTPEQRAAKIVAIAAVLWLLLAIFFPSGFTAVMPRLFAPWQDDVTPPWSATKFDVEPRGASLRFGDSIDISVNVSGQMPNDVALMIRTRGQDQWQRLEMSGDEPGRYSITLQTVSADTQYYVQANTGRSAKYWINVAQPPIITALLATYQPPTYTGRPAYSEAVGSGVIHGLQGTKVTLQVTSNRPLVSGSLHLLIGQSDFQLVMLPTKGAATDAACQFTIDSPGDFRVDLEAIDGQATIDAAKGKIIVDTNDRPNVWIPQPGRNLLVTPKMAIPIQIESQDENALTSITLHRTINNLDDNPLTYSVSGLPKDQTESSEFDLGDLGVRAGDEITYYAEASDNQPGTPNIGVSQTYTLDVVTPEQFQKALAQARTPSKVQSESRDMVAAVNDLTKQQEELAQQIQQTASQLAKHPGDVALQKQLKALAAEQKRLAQQASKLAQQMQKYALSPSGSNFERALKAKVAQVAAKIASAAQAMESSANSGSPSQQASAAQKAAHAMDTANAQVAQQVQQAAEAMMKMWPLYNDVERFFALLTAQGELVLEARQFQDHNGTSTADTAEMRDLANRQDRIEQALVGLQSDFRVDATQAEDKFPRAAASAREIADEIDQRRMPQLMSSARDAFRRTDGTIGFQFANSALVQMQAMVHYLRGMQGGQQSELSDSLSLTLGQGGLGQSLQQLAGSGFGMGNSASAGNGMGIGVGGMIDGPSGTPGGSQPENGNSPEPYTPTTDFKNGTAGPDKIRHRNTIPGQADELSPNDIEVTQPGQGAPSKPGNQNTTSFPAQYRKLISDYYRSVANGQ